MVRRLPGDVSTKSRMDLKVPTAVCHTALLYVLYYCSYCSSRL
eukprot:COSAG06_NODE_49474_length_325_cov_0.716814_1_plen_42_part_10